jgi:hypothetical protein
MVNRSYAIYRLFFFRYALCSMLYANWTGPKNQVFDFE